LRDGYYVFAINFVIYALLHSKKSHKGN